MTDDDTPPRCPGWEYTDPRYNGAQSFFPTAEELAAHFAAAASWRPCASGHLHNAADLEESAE